MGKDDLEKLALIKKLADELGVKLEGSNISIATEKEVGKVKIYNNSLETTVYAGETPKIYLDSFRCPGIKIEMVDPQKDVFAPKGAIYRIIAYNLNTDSTITPLNGDIASVYITKDGLELNRAARERAKKLPAITFQAQD